MRAENETLRAALRMQLAWVRHWREDARCGLRPTMDSLLDAEEAINSALSRTRSLEAAE